MKIGKTLGIVVLSLYLSSCFKSDHKKEQLGSSYFEYQPIKISALKSEIKENLERQSSLEKKIRGYEKIFRQPLKYKITLKKVFGVDEIYKAYYLYAIYQINPSSINLNIIDTNCNNGNCDFGLVVNYKNFNNDSRYLVFPASLKNGILKIKNLELVYDKEFSKLNKKKHLANVLVISILSENNPKVRKKLIEKLVSITK